MFIYFELPFKSRLTGDYYSINTGADYLSKHPFDMKPDEITYQLNNAVQPYFKEELDLIKKAYGEEAVKELVNPNISRLNKCIITLDAAVYMYKGLIEVVKLITDHDDVDIVASYKRPFDEYHTRQELKFLMSEITTSLLESPRL